MAIYDTKIMFAINGKDVRSFRFQQPIWYSVSHCPIIWSCCLEIQTIRAIFMISHISACMLTMYMDSHPSSLVFSISIWFRCSCFSAISCSASDIIVLLLFIAMLSMISPSILSDQYACRFSAPQLWSMASCRI